MLKEENSGIRSPLKDPKRVLGNKSMGKTIPLIIPYLERDSLQLNPKASNFIGINICFRVDSPDLIYVVEEIGRDILKILFVILF